MDKQPVIETSPAETTPQSAYRVTKDLQQKLTSGYHELATILQGLPKPSIIEDDDDAFEDAQRQIQDIMDMVRFLRADADRIDVGFLDSEGRDAGSVYEPCFFLPSGVFNLLSGMRDNMNGLASVLEAKADRILARIEE